MGPEHTGVQELCDGHVNLIPGCCWGNTMQQNIAKFLNVAQHNIHTYKIQQIKIIILNKCLRIFAYLWTTVKH